MKVINKSRKIIAVNGEAFLPGKEMELTTETAKHPSIKRFLKDGVLADASAAKSSETVADAERARIAEEAVAKYKAEQEAAAALEAKIASVKTMKKSELVKEAMALEIEAADSDTVDVLREKVLAALGK